MMTEDDGPVEELQQQHQQHQQHQHAFLDDDQPGPSRRRSHHGTPPARGHRKSSSWNSPPAPPFDFNPPPDFAPSAADTLNGIAGPSSHSAPVSGTGSPWGQPLPSSSPFIPPPHHAHESSSVPNTNDNHHLPRPQIRAIQRMSTDSVHHQSGQSSHSSSGRGGGASDSGEVLAARRDELVSHLLTGDLVAGAGCSTPDLQRPGSPSEHIASALGSIGLHNAASTSASSLPSAIDDSHHEAQTQTQTAGAMRPRSSSRSEESVHLWDSVWPAPNAAHRVPTRPDAGAAGSSPRFPMAPISPYVTPSFSPSVVQTTRRLSSSPPHSPLPRLLQPDGGFAPPEQQPPQLLRSGSSAHRVLQQARGHSGYFSSSSRPDSASPHSPDTSPRLAPVSYPPPALASPSALSSPGSSASPGSPGSGPSRRRSFVAQGPPSLHRSQTSPTGQSGHNNNNLRPRPERSASSFSNQFPELAPPFISRKELLTSSSRLTRRSSETAISRPRPNASSLYGGDSLTMSAVVHPPASKDVLARPTSSSSFPHASPGGSYLSPADATRPAGPRRAKSAQDASGILHSRLRAAGLAMTPEHSPNPAGLHSPNLENTTTTPPSRPLASPLFQAQPSSPSPPSSPSDLARHPYDMDDDSAIADDCEEDADAPPRDHADTTLSAQTFRIEAPAPAHRMSMTEDISRGLVDEGDVLPAEPGIFDADVTFDDEGLTTLERIFLLSRSEYSFHRAYVARVLGDLLNDVDPCEAVEYVLPLLSGFSLDEEDTVKEAFASDLHRILWYYYTNCRLGVGDEMPGEYELHVTDTDDVSSFHSLPESITQLERAIRTPQQMDMSRAESEYDGNSNPSSQDSRQVSDDTLDSLRSSADTLGMDSSRHADTPMTNMSVGDNDNSNDNSPVYPALDIDDKAWAHAAVEDADPPFLCVGFFRPLLGTLLLSHNPSIADPVRGGLIAIIDRLRGHSEPTAETWGASVKDKEDKEEQSPKQRTFLSQTGPHLHVIPDFCTESRHLVEDELLHCVVLGMGKLSTDVPESLFDNSVEVIGCDEDLAIDREKDEELYRQQMVHEATLGRALSLSLIGSICEMYSPDEVQDYGFVDEVIRGLDGDATTRAEAALAMSFVAKVARDDSIDGLLSAFRMLADDEDDNVRQSACTCLPALSKRIKDVNDRREFAVSHVTSFVHGSEDTRYAALEVLGEVIYTFVGSPDGPPQELVDVFCDDAESEGTEDGDWDVIASFNFPGVCLTLGPKGWPKLRGLFHRIVSRAGERVYRTVSAFLHELANILEPDQVAEDVLPVYRKCLEQGDDIRERIFEHIDVLIRGLPLALGWMSFCRLSDAWKEDTLGGWRAREQLALRLPSFLETFRGHPDVTTVLDVTRSALLDPFAAVRDAATFAVPRTYEILQEYENLASIFCNILVSLSSSQRYRQRVTFVRCLREFMRPPPNRKAFEQFFVPSLLNLAHDVVDVRLALATALADLFVVGAYYGDKKVPVPDAIKETVRILAIDDAVDVRNAVSLVGADRWSRANSYASAEHVLEDEMEHSPNPLALEDKVDEALESRSSEAANQVRPMHERAALASPVPEDGEDETVLLALGGGDDPFAASFARAASVSSMASLAASADASGNGSADGKSGSASGGSRAGSVRDGDGDGGDAGA